MDPDFSIYLADTAVSEYRYFESIGSTNDEALIWIDKGAPDFALIVADEQTKGRGRFDRHWVTRSRTALAFTLILTGIAPDPRLVPLYAPLGGISVQEAVQNMLDLKTLIKWPNDVLVNGKKFCGILVEASWLGHELKGLAMGIGINISPGSIPGEAAQSFPATSLETACGHPLDRMELLKNILMSINRWRTLVGSEVFMNHWQEHLAFKGQWVRIEHSEKPSIIGKMVGIDDNGRLILVRDDGSENRFEIGDVHLRPNANRTTGGNHAG
jgi:BirA family biotin operon repressor/biotin-[acetyl-CoA-carboxylase] ligase